MMLPIFRTETTLILTERPGDEERDCGELIATLSRAGRPPFVVVLTDGAARDTADSSVRARLERCGLAAGRMLMFGIAGSMPQSGPVFDAAVRALCFVSWRHDCNLLYSPDGVVLTAARAAVAHSGVGLVIRSGGIDRLAAAPRHSAREADPAGLLFPTGPGDTISQA